MFLSKDTPRFYHQMANKIAREVSHVRTSEHEYNSIKTTVKKILNQVSSAGVLALVLTSFVSWGVQGEEAIPFRKTVPRREKTLR